MYNIHKIEYDLLREDLTDRLAELVYEELLREGFFVDEYGRIDEAGFRDALDKVWGGVKKGAKSAAMGAAITAGVLGGIRGTAAPVGSPVEPAEVEYRPKKQNPDKIDTRKLQLSEVGAVYTSPDDAYTIERLKDGALLVKFTPIGSEFQYRITRDGGTSRTVSMHPGRSKVISVTVEVNGKLQRLAGPNPFLVYRPEKKGDLAQITISKVGDVQSIGDGLS